MVDTKEKKKFTWPFISGILLLVIGVMVGSLIGQAVKEEEIYNDLSTSIETCEKDNTVLRLYEENGDVSVECFGELPEFDLNKNER